MLKVKNNVGAAFCFDKLFAMFFLSIHSGGLIYEESSGTLFKFLFSLDMIPSRGGYLFPSAYSLIYSSCRPLLNSRL